MNTQPESYSSLPTDVPKTALLSIAAANLRKQSFHIAIRKLKDNVFKTITVLLALAATVPLFLIFFYIFKQGIETIFPQGIFALLSSGIKAINWDFFFNLPAPVGEIGGGIANAILGTFLLIVVSSVMSIPIGVMAGIYLSEFRDGKIAYIVGICMEVLQGIPSIVIGIVAYAWIVQPLRTFSLLSGAIALAFMMLPVIARTTEETMKLVPQNLKEASLALGAPYYVTILRVILPAGISGIVTGVLVSVARIAGETAPLLFTAFGNPYMNSNILKPVESIPHLIYYYATSPYDDWRRIAWGASLVLILFVLLMNIIAKAITRKWTVRY